MRDDMLVRIRGEAKRRLIAHKKETGAEYTFVVNKALMEFFARIDRMREASQQVDIDMGNAMNLVDHYRATRSIANRPAEED